MSRPTADRLSGEDTAYPAISVVVALTEFEERLKQLTTRNRKRGWIFVSYDQLSDEIGPLSRQDPTSLGVILIENARQVSQRPYHKQKIALMWANMRHFALEQAQRGVAVRYLAVDEPVSRTLRTLARELGKIQMMKPAERDLRWELRPLARAGVLEILPHEGWLTTRHQFVGSQKQGLPPWRMDAFYRFVRRETGILMEKAKPTGGRFSFDTQNRMPWLGEPSPPDLPKFQPDAVTSEVGAMIRSRFAYHPGELDLTSLPATKIDAGTLWSWAKANCLEYFGPYEDAMSSQSTSLFHTRISSLLNLHRLTPRRVLEDVLSQPVPIASKEGFVRQVLGWREFMYHVHESTDGFRSLPSPGALNTVERESQFHGQAGASPSLLGARHPLLPAFWGKSSGLNCLDHIIAKVWKEGYSHHITRLMVLANLATLLDVSPRELTDWFWCAYTDAYDWVVEPNVLGMGTYALGDLFTTKPYVSGSVYLKRMSDFCSNCRFDPDKTCPFTSLYWAFLARHEGYLKTNSRMLIAMSSLRKRSPDKRKRDEMIFGMVQETLSAGEELQVTSFHG